MAMHQGCLVDPEGLSANVHAPPQSFDAFNIQNRMITLHATCTFHSFDRTNLPLASSFDLCSDTRLVSRACTPHACQNTSGQQLQ